MKIIASSWKNGTVKLMPESLDDLWVLAQTIKKDDRIKGRTIRKIKIEGSEKGDVIKRPMTVVLKVEKVEWGSTQGTLRVAGTVLDAPEDVPRGSHHTLTLEEREEFTLEKENWPQYLVKRIEEASKNITQPVIACVFDREEAHIAVMKKYGYDIIANLKGDVQKKRVPDAKFQNFFKDLGTHIENYAKRYAVERIIIGSPSFWKDELMKSWEPNDDIRKKIILATCASGDESAITELLRRPETQAALSALQTVQETERVEVLFERIAKNKPVAYGFDAVQNAAEQGAASEVLVSEQFFTSDTPSEKREFVEKILGIAEKTGATVHLINTTHQAGQRLIGLGGIAAILRFSIE